MELPKPSSSFLNELLGVFTDGLVDELSDELPDGLHDRVFDGLVANFSRWSWSMRSAIASRVHDSS